MKATGDSKVLTIEVLLEETRDNTEAKAVLAHGVHRYTGWGRAKRNPSDPAVPEIGEELATARALADVSHQLLEVAAAAIESFEGEPIRPHL
jgi:hypothetical protein